MDKYLEKAYEYAIAFCDKGEVANYIPELAKQDKTKSAVAFIDEDGIMYSKGYSKDKFTIQSIVKVIIYLCLLENYDFDQIKKSIGVMPSSKPFNSIIELELSDKNIPVNPFINAGAIVGTYLLYEKYGDKTFHYIMDRARQVLGNKEIIYSLEVFKSERASAYKNKALSYMMQASGIIPGNINVETILDFYFKACSILVNVEELAYFSYILSNDGKSIGKERVIDSEHARILRTLMAVCGTYDFSGDFAVKIGLPCKSGVGGGLLTASKNGYGLASYCPGLDRHGNSYVGMKILQALSNEFELSIY